MLLFRPLLFISSFISTYLPIPFIPSFILNFSSSSLLPCIFSTLLCSFFLSYFIRSLLFYNCLPTHPPSSSHCHPALPLFSCFRVSLHTTQSPFSFISFTSLSAVFPSSLLSSLSLYLPFFYPPFFLPCLRSSLSHLSLSASLPLFLFHPSNPFYRLPVLPPTQHTEAQSTKSVLR